MPGCGRSPGDPYWSPEIVLVEKHGFFRTTGFRTAPCIHRAKLRVMDFPSVASPGMCIFGPGFSRDRDVASRPGRQMAVDCAGADSCRWPGRPTRPDIRRTIGGAVPEVHLCPGRAALDRKVVPGGGIQPDVV